jgi:hypothetical protein
MATRAAISFVLISACGVETGGIESFGGTMAAAETSAGSSGGSAAVTSQDGGPAETTPPADSSSGGGAVFDVGAGDTGPGGDCECGSQLSFSYIWIANTIQNTVSKVNTETLVEEARYRTHAANGNPSRTSVSVDGLAVAVANRFGGVTKVWASSALCDPMTNGVPGLQTSSGPSDVLDFGQDDCVAWHAEFDYASQRPVAWTAGTLDPDTCRYEDQVVWTSGCSNETDPSVFVHKLDGNTGATLATVELDGYPCIGFGGYGGAVDGEDNFWVSSLDHAKLVRIDNATLDDEIWQAPFAPYGITVDAAGRPWMACSFSCTAMRFDPDTAEFDVITDERALSGQSGIAPDAEGRMWINTWNQDLAKRGIVPIDIETLEIGELIPMPLEAKGISVDLAGNVWSVSGGPAYRVDATTGMIDSVSGFMGPYTYSDMTGWALQNAHCNPEG